MLTPITTFLEIPPPPPLSSSILQTYLTSAITIKLLTFPENTEHLNSLPVRPFSCFRLRTLHCASTNGACPSRAHQPRSVCRQESVTNWQRPSLPPPCLSHPTRYGNVREFHPIECPIAVLFESYRYGISYRIVW